MQVRTLPGLVLPRLPTNTPQRAVAPVPAQDERSQPAVIIPANRQPESTDVALLSRHNQRANVVNIEADGSRTSRALQTYFNIETQDDQERSQALFGIDILA